MVDGLRVDVAWSGLLVLVVKCVFYKKYFENVSREFDEFRVLYSSLQAAVEESWCRKVRGKGRRGISFAWRQHRFFFIDLLSLVLSHDKLEETGK